MNQTLAKAMSSSAAAAARINQQINPERFAQDVSQFQAETSKMQMKDEILESAFEDLFDNSEEEAESDAIMDQVLAEIGVDISNALPVSNPALKEPIPSATKEQDDELSQKLNKLRSI